MELVSTLLLFLAPWPRRILASAGGGGESPPTLMVDRIEPSGRFLGHVCGAAVLPLRCSAVRIHRHCRLGP
jgi:hypothetical protein